jgi:O-antigen ligase
MLAAYWAMLGSAVASVFSIAVSQSLLGISIAAILASGEKPRLPVWWPAVAAFLGLTLISWLASGDLKAGLPQIRKLYVWASLIVVVTVMRSERDIRRLVIAWWAIGVLAALRGCWQFWQKWHTAQLAGDDFYRSYVGARITGFMSHWMTFSGQMLIVFALAGALVLLSATSRRWRMGMAAGLCIIAAAIVLGMTRGIWLATGAVAVYLLWTWKRWTVAIVPLMGLALFVAGPAGVKERMTSLVKPRGQLDSNQHRIVTWRTGMEMVKAHPLLGLGPENVGRKFQQYVPADIPRPLPEGWYGHLHNIYLHYSAERGIPAMLCLLWAFAWALWDWTRKLRGSAEGRWALHGGIALVAGILITGLFEHNLGDSEILLMTLAALGAVSAMAREAHGDEPKLVTRS